MDECEGGGGEGEDDDDLDERVETFFRSKRESREESLEENLEESMVGRAGKAADKESGRISPSEFQHRRRQVCVNTHFVCGLQRGVKTAAVHII